MAGVISASGYLCPYDSGGRRLRQPERGRLIASIRNAPEGMASSYLSYQ